MSSRPTLTPTTTTQPQPEYHTNSQWIISLVDHIFYFKIRFFKSIFFFLLLLSIITISFWEYYHTSQDVKTFNHQPISFQSIPSQNFHHGYENRFSRFKTEKKIALADRKLLVRDWSTYLGWNNMRYIIEHGLLLADILDRELVLPSFVFLTGCKDSDEELCGNVTSVLSQDAPLNLSNVPKQERWRYPEPEEGTDLLKLNIAGGKKGWVMSLDVLLDVPHLNRFKNRALRFEDYLKLTTSGLSLTQRSSRHGRASGTWSQSDNHNLTYRKIPNSFFTTPGKIIVNRLPDPIIPLLPYKNNHTNISTSVPPWVLPQCKSTLTKIKNIKHYNQADVEQAKFPETLTNLDFPAFPSWNDDLIKADQMIGELADRDHHLLERCIASEGYRSAYGYGELTLLTKSSNDRKKYFHKEESMVGIWNQLQDYNETILHLEGELHRHTFAGSMIWRALSDRKGFEKLIQTLIRPPEVYDQIASRLELRMRERCEGRSWRASHMRRGDFIPIRWSFKDIRKHYQHIQKYLNASIAILQDEPELLIAGQKAYQTSLKPPNLKDPIYLATNANSKQELEFLKTQKIVLLDDLLDDRDLHQLGFRSSFRDLLSIVEQCLLMRSGFFYGDAHSSVGGWVFNMRVFHGIDERLTPIKFFKHPRDPDL